MSRKDDFSRGGRGRTRKFPCVNHPGAAAVARCQVCGEPICRECVNSYEGEHICGNQCWLKRSAEQSGKVSAEERRQRRMKEKKADRLVTIGLWAVLLVCAGLAGAFAYMKFSSTEGEKTWEFKKVGGYFHYSVRPGLTTFFLLSGSGDLEAIDSLTGRPKWSATLPEQRKGANALAINDNQCLVYSDNVLFLCRAEQDEPAWKYEARQPRLSAEPIFSHNRVYAACSIPDSYSWSFARMFDSSRSPTTGEKPQEESRFSTVCAVDMETGEELWAIELKEIRVTCLLADGSRVYAVGHRFSRYESYAEKERAGGTQGETEDAAEQTPFTEIWALDAATGEPQWKLEGTGDFSAPPMTASPGIVFATTRNIYLISPKGEGKWTYPLEKTRLLSFQPHRDKLFFTTKEGFLNCIDLESGKWKWMAKVGADASKIVVAPPVVITSGLTEIDKEPPKVIPTRRWEGSQDLLKKALKSVGATQERRLHGIDIETGDEVWSVPKVTGDFQYRNEALYALRYFDRLQFFDASADPSEIAKTISNLGAYDAFTGERLWEVAIDGYASGMGLTDYTAVVMSRESVLSIAGGSRPAEVRLIGVSLR